MQNIVSPNILRELALKDSSFCSLYLQIFLSSVSFSLAFKHIKLYHYRISQQWFAFYTNQWRLLSQCFTLFDLSLFETLYLKNFLYYHHFLPAFLVIFYFTCELFPPYLHFKYWYFKWHNLRCRTSKGPHTHTHTIIRTATWI